CDPGGADPDCRTLCGRQGPEFDNRLQKPLTASSTPGIPRRVSAHAEPSAACCRRPRQPETTRGCLQLNGCRRAGAPTEPARRGCRAEPDQPQHIIPPQPDPCPQPDFPNVRQAAGGNHGQGMEQLQQRRNGGDTATVVVAAPGASVFVLG